MQSRSPKQHFIRSLCFVTLDRLNFANLKSSQALFGSLQDSLVCFRGGSFHSFKNLDEKLTRISTLLCRLDKNLNSEDGLPYIFYEIYENSSVQAHSYSSQWTIYRYDIFLFAHCHFHLLRHLQVFERKVAYQSMPQ